MHTCNHKLHLCLLPSGIFTSCWVSSTLFSSSFFAFQQHNVIISYRFISVSSAYSDNSYLKIELSHFLSFSLPSLPYMNNPK